ncbi:MAG: BREX-3 system phosphatase PglZ, partial [Chloroflexota bacterium]|nr:BREX-3 system phosphatase PglZ [Chloroflexota bacterium]
RAHLGQLDGTWPQGDVSHRDWIAFAWRWAELRARIGVVSHDLDARLALVSELKPVQLPMDEAFDEWIRHRYALLPSLVSMGTPIMVHQIPGILEREICNGDRVALVVMDGMALDHWVTLRGLLSGHGQPMECEENACFACLPTLTSVSRQAIFAGRLPSSFPDTWNTTAKESRHWQRLGGDWGLPPVAVRYAHLRLRSLVEGTDPCLLVSDLDDYRTRLMAIVVPDIDELAHAATLGMADMQHDIRLWAAAGHWSRLIEGLLERGFTVYITADHGSIEAEGKGQPREGVTVDQRAMRARVYEREEYLAPVLAAHPFAREWTPVGLPEGLRVLVPEQLSAFAPPGEIVVAHGGLSLEEVVVPFIRLRRI